MFHFFFILLSLELVAISIATGYAVGAIQRRRDIWRADPHRRSLELLRGWLDPEQLVQFKNGPSFDVTGEITGYRYRINSPGIYSIDKLCECGGSIENLCFEPRAYGLPAGDIMVMQKIALEKDEVETLRIANSSIHAHRLCMPDGIIWPKKPSGLADAAQAIYGCAPPPVDMGITESDPNIF